MTKEDAYKFIPQQFTVAANTINVVVEDEGNDFGIFDILRNQITVYLSCRDNDGTLVTFTREQVQNTFYHELIHCFNYFFNTETDEALAQSFANFICEYLKTKVD